MPRDPENFHFDTFDSNSIYTTWSAYDTTFKLPSAIKNIRKITLTSLEMPVVFPNIRQENTSNIFNITIGSTNYNIVLGDYNYTSIANLITDINAKLGSIATLSLLNTVFIRITLPTPNTITVNNSILANIVLGFPKNASSSGSVNYYQGLYVYNLNYDNFVSLFLNIPSNCTSSGNHLISYKIPLNAIQGMVFYLGQNSTFEQSIIVSDNNFVLSQFRIQVFDRFGYYIRQANDYTFSLTIHYNN
jgi:hypothetical protein